MIIEQETKKKEKQIDNHVYIYSQVRSQAKAEIGWLYNPWALSPQSPEK